MNTFFEQVCTMDWNENQDAGYPLSQATEDRIGLFPEYETLIKIYYEIMCHNFKFAIKIFRQLNPSF